MKNKKKEKKKTTHNKAKAIPKQMTARCKYGKDIFIIQHYLA